MQVYQLRYSLINMTFLVQVYYLRYSLINMMWHPSYRSTIYDTAWSVWYDILRTSLSHTIQPDQYDMTFFVQVYHLQYKHQLEVDLRSSPLHNIIPWNYVWAWNTLDMHGTALLLHWWGHRCAFTPCLHREAAKLMAMCSDLASRRSHFVSKVCSLVYSNGYIAPEFWSLEK